MAGIRKQEELRIESKKLEVFISEESPGESRREEKINAVDGKKQEDVRAWRFEDKKPTADAFCTPPRGTPGGIARRSPGSRRKWLDRFLHRRERRGGEKRWHSKLLRALQHLECTPLSNIKVTRKMVSKNLLQDFEEERAEIRPNFSVSVEDSSGKGALWSRSVGDSKEWDTRGPEVEGEELMRDGHGLAGVATKPLLPLTAAGDTNHNFTLRQSREGEGEEDFHGWGPEMWWWDQWQGQGWSGPLSPVYFCCLGCQLGGEGRRHLVVA